MYSVFDSGRRDDGRKTSRGNAASSTRRNPSGSDNTGNSSEESLEIIPSSSGGSNRGNGARSVPTDVDAEYPASSPSPPAAEERPLIGNVDKSGMKSDN